MTTASSRPIALVLSGGGIRAMAFHLGVLKFLAENHALENVVRISSVSGGSLLVGLMLQEERLAWPSSSTFSRTIYPALREKLCVRSMQWGALRQLGRPGNWRFLLSRANLLAAALKREWGIGARLADLPVHPEWSINGTNAENGRRFRFKHNSLGDYLTGYAAPGNFPLASALAVSAAFPGGFGPLSLRTEGFLWQKREWDAPTGSEQAITPSHKTLHLYDGGVYDNLGLEPVFDAGRGASKFPDHLIILSDAGMPLTNGFSSGPLSPFRFKRVADIMSDQSHALRIRTFMHFLQGAPGRGALVSISDRSNAALSASRDFAVAFPTTLRALQPKEFDKLAGHGYGVAALHIGSITTRPSEPSVA